MDNNELNDQKTLRWRGQTNRDAQRVNIIEKINQ